MPPLILILTFGMSLLKHNRINIYMYTKSWFYYSIVIQSMFKRTWTFQSNFICQWMFWGLLNTSTLRCFIYTLFFRPLSYLEIEIWITPPFSGIMIFFMAVSIFWKFKSICEIYVCKHYSMIVRIEINSKNNINNWLFTEQYHNFTKVLIK